MNGCHPSVLYASALGMFKRNALNRGKRRTMFLNMTINMLRERDDSQEDGDQPMG